MFSKFHIYLLPLKIGGLSVTCENLSSGGLKPCCLGREHKNARCEHPRDPRLIAGGAQRQLGGMSEAKFERVTDRSQSDKLLLPFYCRRRFGRDVVNDSVHSLYLRDDIGGNLLQEFERKVDDLCGHGIH